MKLADLFEAPLPDDWDVDVFSPSVPFTRRVAYAKERAKQVGRGSSRVAFETPYKGRKTVLKIAMNRKGMVQNEEEARLLDDYYLAGLGIVIPLIDYDERSSTPTWIHTEYAKPITNKQLSRFFGDVDISDITRYLDWETGKLRGLGRPDLPEEIHENEYFEALRDLVVGYGIPAGDFARKANWGIYKGGPVIIDLGYTDVTAELYR